MPKHEQVVDDRLCCVRVCLTLRSMRHLSLSTRAGTSLSMMDSDVCSAHRINMDPTPLPLHRLAHLQHMYICIVDTQLGQCTASSERIRYTIYNCYEPMLTALLVLGSEMQAVANQLLMVLTTEASAHGTSIMHIQLGC